MTNGRRDLRTRVCRLLAGSIEGYHSATRGRVPKSVAVEAILGTFRVERAWLSRQLRRGLA